MYQSEIIFSNVGLVGIISTTQQKKKTYKCIIGSKKTISDAHIFLAEGAELRCGALDAVVGCVCVCVCCAVSTRTDNKNRIELEMRARWARRKFAG